MSDQEIVSNGNHDEEEIIGTPIKVYQYEEIEMENREVQLKNHYLANDDNNNSSILSHGTLNDFSEHVTSESTQVVIKDLKSNEEAIQDTFENTLGDECGIENECHEERIYSNDNGFEIKNEGYKSYSSSSSEDEEILEKKTGSELTKSDVIIKSSSKLNKPVFTIRSWTNEIEDKPGDGFVRHLLETWYKKEENMLLLDSHWRKLKNQLHPNASTLDSTGLNVVLIESETISEMPQKQSSRFQVESPSSKREFQIRRQSVLKPVSETIITDIWIQNAVKHYENVQSNDEIRVVSSEFNGEHPKYHAKIEAEVNDKKKTYNWIIKAKTLMEDSALFYSDLTVDTSSSRDFIFKSTNIESSIGTQIQKFIDKNMKDKKKSFRLAFADVIFSDMEYAIFDDIGCYNKVSGPFFDFQQFKIALKALARLHASSYAYFLNSNEEDMNTISENLKLIIDTPYQPTTTEAMKKQTINELNSTFNIALKYIGDKYLEKEVDQKVENEFLYSIFHRARTSSSPFSVLCHGRPTVECFFFQNNAMDKSYIQEEANTIKDVKFTSFENARYANAVTDLQILFNTSLDPKFESQIDFLLRYEYYETLVGTLHNLNVTSFNLDLNQLKKELKSQQLYGYVYSAMLLTSKATELNGINKEIHDVIIERSKDLIYKFIKEKKVAYFTY
uniref:Putative LOC100164898 [Acyrthosiphon pisum] n=1 Tax=Lepeophtheirus salmonis TaxID=72036 RepID=A0A0K2TJY2_LEPSM